MSLDETVKKVAKRLDLAESKEDPALHCPSRKAVIGILKNLQKLMFPRFFPGDDGDDFEKEPILRDVAGKMLEQIRAAFLFAGTPTDKAEELTDSILQTLPEVREKLLLDIEALYEGDPAAKCPEEVILTYPGFYAISIYRIAHEFYIRNIPFLSRMMTEYAHEKTGIDIHAGAKIGNYFFIDHGTGIVVGETTTIGDHVKMYQGVTLGAKSFELDPNGNPVKGIKRHPDIGNYVVLYANATILGGSTKIGDRCVIGGNVWLTHSVEAGKTVVYSEKH